MTINKYLMGVNGELSYEELRSICQTKVPRGKYYNYEKIRAVLLRKLNGEIDDEYFQTWLIVVSWALNKGKYANISWMFDGYSFQSCFDEKLVLEIMATFKDLDYKLRHKNYIKRHKKDGLKVVYLRFQHCNWTADSGIYKAYFVDYKNKRFDIRMVDDAFFNYNDDVLYCEIAPKECVDEETHEVMVVEPFETQEEEQLMSYFFNEEEEWIYDHTLNF